MEGKAKPIIAKPGVESHNAKNKTDKCQTKSCEPPSKNYTKAKAIIAKHKAQTNSC
jgi:hypothetical protein